MKPFDYYSQNPIPYPSKQNYATTYLYDSGWVVWKGNLPGDKEGYESARKAYPNSVTQVTLDEEAYRQARAAYQRENDRLFKELKNDLFEEFGVADNPKRFQCFEIAKDWGSGSGMQGIYERFEILVELIK